MKPLYAVNRFTGVKMTETHGFKLSSAHVDMRPDRCFDCFFNSPKGPVQCVIMSDAVTVMADHCGEDPAWAMITRSWGIPLATIAADKSKRHPQESVVIISDDLRPFLGQVLKAKG